MELLQNVTSAAAPFFVPSRRSMCCCLGNIHVFGYNKASPATKTELSVESFQFETAMLPEYQKDGFVSGRFPVSSTTFSN